MPRKTSIWLRTLTFGTAATLGVALAGSSASAVGARRDASVRAEKAAGPVSYRAVPTFSRPPNKGAIFEPESAYPLALTHGYVQKELFASGRATAFKATATPKNGKWSIARTKSASYRTRILVRRPPKSRFNGTVVVEWMNVTEGEAAPDWDYLNPMLMRAGYAYVAVSDQALGVNGGTSLFGQKSPGLVGSDPARYGSLHHPGDKYSLDIFAQIGAALHNPKTASQVLGGLRPKHVVATGESQSAYYLTTFANALQPKTHAYDGIFIHSRGGGAAKFDGTITTGPYNVRVRTDLHVPVFMFETETDLITLHYATAQQPNTHLIRTWEVAGTSHADTLIVGPYTSFLGCTTPINDGPQHIVVQAAFTALAKWVEHATAPPKPKRFQFTAAHPAKLALAADGDVRGGVRTPAVDVPIATLSGAAPKGANETCSLFGSTTPFTKAALVKRYGTAAHYLALYKASLHTAIAHGYVLKADQAGLIAKARKVTF
jgi:Alpha/beta hydrolase domain